MPTQFARWMRDTSFACGLVLATAVVGSGQDRTDLAETSPAVKGQAAEKKPSATQTKTTKTSTSTQSSIEIRTESSESKNGQPPEPVKRQITIVQKSHSDSSRQPATTKGRVKIVGPDGVIKDFDIEDLSNATQPLQISTDGYEIRTIKTPHGETSVMTVIIDDSGAIVSPQPKKPRKVGKHVEPPAGHHVEVRKSVSIGVQLQPLSDALKSQLRLNLGLQIENVLPDSPASEAGLLPHDIILMVGESKVTDHPTLQKSIQESDGKPLKLTLLRAGEKQYVTVTPRRQTLVMASPETQHAEIVKLLEKLQSEGSSSIRLQLIRPGIMAKDAEELQQVREKLMEKLKANHKAVEQHDKASKERLTHTPQAADTSDLKSEVEALRKQVQELQKAMKTLQSQTTPKPDASGKRKQQE